MKKNILQLITILSCVSMWAGCHDIPIGDLDAVNARYHTDSLVIKAVLDPDIPSDNFKIKFNIPWQSDPLEGVDGTPPINYRIDIFTENLNADLSQIYLTGKAKISINPNHTLPLGRYYISLMISNESHSDYHPKIFTLIVE